MKPLSSRESDGEACSSTLTLATFLPYRLNVLAATVSEGLARAYAERFGIGVPEWRVLATVGEFESITATAIGAHAHMGKVKVSRAAAALEARGYLRRMANEEDRREAFLRLTPEGKKAYCLIARLALGYVRELTAEMTPAELAAFESIAERLRARAAKLEVGTEAVG